MYQGTTPTIPFTIKGMDLTQARVFITLQDQKTRKTQTYDSSGDRLVVSYSAEENETTIQLTLTQEETLAISKGMVVAQARWVLANDQAGASDKASLTVHDVINKEVITYE
jgi:hypothetical protein